MEGVRGRFSSSFLYLSVRLAPSFVRSLFVLCSFFVRSLFVLCSSFVRLLFVFPSSFVRLYVAVVPPLEGVRGRFPSFFLYLPVRLAPSFVRLTFPVTTLPLLGSSLRIGEYVIGERIFCSSIL